MSGLDLLERTRKVRPHCIGVVLSGFTDKSDLITAINRGDAFQYITKPWSPDQIRAIVQRALEHRQLIFERDKLARELKESHDRLEEANARLEREVEARTADLTAANDELRLINEQLARLAITDSLTGLFNHRYFQDFLAAEMRRGERYGNPVGVVMLDVDRFKLYNDTNGHQAGDRALQILSELLRKELRDVDVAARYGGEEFILVLPQTDLAGAEKAAARIRERILATAFPHAETQPLGRLTVSFGVTWYQPRPETEGARPSELIERADKALYQSKKDGGNRVTVFDE
jgi:diguanylate cyclase (GGDEF)-like protein